MVVLLAALAVAALFIWETRVLTPVAIDDAYITFSYSKNLATGHGPVYGHGERVEGYSNFLWMVAVAIGLLVSPRGADPLLVARATAMPFIALLGFATYRLARARASASAGDRGARGAGAGRRRRDRVPDGAGDAAGDGVSDAGLLAVRAFDRRGRHRRR